MLTSDCISLASSDVKYNNLTDSLKAKGEYQFLKKSLSTAKHGIHQGVYIITPSGQLISQIKWGWPLPDVAKINAQLEQSISDYKQMSKVDRLGNKRLTENDRSMSKNTSFTAPKSWLQLRNTTRSYAFSEMNLFDIRHPSFVTVDKLWFSDKEKLRFVPSDLSTGKREKIAPDALNRMLVNSHLITGRSAWWSEHTQLAKMEMEVIAIKKNQVLIHYSGEFNQQANSKWCKQKYNGTLLGKATWDRTNKCFTSFEWVSLGEHELDKLLPNMHKGSTKSVIVASKLELDLQPKCEIGIAPASWPESYSKEMQATLEALVGGGVAPK